MSRNNLGATFNNQNKQKKNNFISENKRLTLTYIVFFVWVSLAVFGIYMKADLRDLAIYFTSGLPVILGYLWAETSRPSGAPSNKELDIAAILNAMNRNNQPPYPQPNPYPNPYPYPQPHPYPPYPMDGANVQPQNSNQHTEPTLQDKVIIYSTDSTQQLQINQSQLSTLTTLGYIRNIQGKYTFDSKMLSQIKSLISVGDTTENDPNI